MRGHYCRKARKDRTGASRKNTRAVRMGGLLKGMSVFPVKGPGGRDCLEDGFLENRVGGSEVWKYAHDTTDTTGR